MIKGYRFNCWNSHFFLLFFLRILILPYFMDRIILRFAVQSKLIELFGNNCSLQTLITLRTFLATFVIRFIIFVFFYWWKFLLQFWYMGIAINTGSIIEAHKIIKLSDFDTSNNTWLIIKFWILTWPINETIKIIYYLFLLFYFFYNFDPFDYILILGIFFHFHICLFIYKFIFYFLVFSNLK